MAPTDTSRSELPMTPLDAKSDYGSDVEIHTSDASDYGSEFDAEEETLIGDLLARIATTAPTQQAILLSETQTDHVSPAPGAITLQRHVTVELEIGRGDGDAINEMVCDWPAEGTRDGMGPQTGMRRRLTH